MSDEQKPPLRLEDLPPVLTQQQVNEVLGISATTAWRQTAHGNFPLLELAPRLRSPRYSKADLIAYLEQPKAGNRLRVTRRRRYRHRAA
jgi:predicted DNA-binding transcriptional regulator AlpA